MQLFKRKSKEQRQRERGTREYDHQWRQWIEKQLAQGVTRQALFRELRQRGLALPIDDDRGEKEALFGLASELSNEMFARNMRGKELEKVGQTDEAIALYEANLRDEFSGTHPYERLRILYAERKDWDNAVRVCLAAMHALGTSEKIQRFSEWAIKYDERRT